MSDAGQPSDLWTAMILNRDFMLQSAPPRYVCCICTGRELPVEATYSRQELSDHYQAVHKEEFEQGTKCHVCENYFFELSGHMCPKFIPGPEVGRAVEEQALDPLQDERVRGFLLNCLKAGGVFRHFFLESAKVVTDAEDQGMGFALHSLGLLLACTSTTALAGAAVASSPIGKALCSKTRILIDKIHLAVTTSGELSVGAKLCAKYAEEAESIWVTLREWATKNSPRPVDDGFVMVQRFAIDYVKEISDLTRGLHSNSREDLIRVYSVVNELESRLTSDATPQ